jgi:hypothetical protein
MQEQDKSFVAGMHPDLIIFLSYGFLLIINGVITKVIMKLRY